MMQLNSHKPDFARILQKQNLNWSIKSFQPNDWVHLLKLPSPFSFDQALLLCQISNDEWIAWIPDHGEARLHVSQFCACS